MGRDVTEAIPNAATLVIDAATAHALGMGVALVVEWQDEQERLTFVVERRSGAPGSGAATIAELLRLADEAGLEVAIDVLESIPELVHYYRRFGFRAFSEATDPILTEAEEEAGVADLRVRRNRFLTTAGNAPSDLGVTFMWRTAPRYERKAQ